MKDDVAVVEDAAGLQTLELFSDTVSFNQWMFDVVRPFCKGDILEIGSGIGNLSGFLIKLFPSVTLSDQKETYCGILEKKFSSHPGCKGVLRLDLSDKRLTDLYPELSGKFDTVIALNVIEHIKDEQTAMENIKSLLKDNGRIIMLVPAFNVLYNGIDIQLGHYRRYNKKHIRTLFRPPYWTLESLRFFNSPGVFGWWLYGAVLRQKMITPGSLSVYNRLVPVFRLSDRFFRHFFGLSLVAVATVHKK